jgi:hypothetical protein
MRFLWKGVTESEHAKSPVIRRSQTVIPITVATGNVPGAKEPASIFLKNALFVEAREIVDSAMELENVHFAMEKARSDAKNAMEPD